MEHAAAQGFVGQLMEPAFDQVLNRPRFLAASLLAAPGRCAG